MRLPTLALAVDDALIGFAERLASILATPPAVLPPLLGDVQHSQVPPPLLPSTHMRHTPYTSYISLGFS